MTTNTCPILPSLPIYIRRSSTPHDACRHGMRYIRIPCPSPSCLLSEKEHRIHKRSIHPIISELVTLFGSPWEPEMTEADQAENEALAAYLTEAYASAPNTIYRGSLPPCTQTGK